MSPDETRKMTPLPILLGLLVFLPLSSGVAEQGHWEISMNHVCGSSAKFVYVSANSNCVVPSCGAQPAETSLRLSLTRDCLCVGTSN